MSIDHFCKAVKRPCQSQDAFVSEAYLLTLARFLNMFAVLDELKNIKASVKNDYATYRRYTFSAFSFCLDTWCFPKSTRFLQSTRRRGSHRVRLQQLSFCCCRRASEITRKHVEEARVRESQELSIFLGTHNSFRVTLKKQLANNVQTHEDLICDVVNSCLHMYENNQYLLPGDKHMLLKVNSFNVLSLLSEGPPFHSMTFGAQRQSISMQVMGFGLHLIDSAEVNINKLEGKRKINLSKIDKIFAVSLLVLMQKFAICCLFTATSFG